MKTSVALLASSALLLPTAVLASPAEAASEATTVMIKNCSKTRHGVTVRIKLRKEATFTRMRVSHPRGKGNFYEPRVRRVEGPGSGQPIGPSFRIPATPGDNETVIVFARFELRSGESIRLVCSTS